MKVKLSDLQKVEPVKIIQTGLGSLRMFSIPFDHQVSLLNELDLSLEGSTPETYVKNLAVLVCYPENELKDDEVIPDETVLTLEDAEKLNINELEEIAKCFLDSNDNFFRILKLRHRSNDKNDELDISDNDKIEHAKQDSENYIQCLYRLSRLAREKQKNTLEHLNAPSSDSNSTLQPQSSDIADNQMLEKSLTSTPNTESKSPELTRKTLEDLTRRIDESLGSSVQSPEFLFEADRIQTENATDIRAAREATNRYERNNRTITISVVFLAVFGLILAIWFNLSELNLGDQQEASVELKDRDSDGLTDSQETILGTNPLLADSDSDGLSDLRELELNTNLLEADTDADGVVDGLELESMTDPLLADSDEDGLLDGQEIDLGTNPLLIDSDADGLLDGEETRVGSNPVLSDSDKDGLTDGEEDLFGSNPQLADSDEDGLTDSRELELFTDILNADSDSDGLTDGQETDLDTNPLLTDNDADVSTDGEQGKTGSDPQLADSDSDELPDGEEISAGTNRLLADSDEDGLTDAQELANKTDPLSADSESDGLTDSEESELGTDTLQADSDEDVLTDSEEGQYGSDPQMTDSDEDGITDGQEFENNTDPVLSDSDGDGLTDGEESELGTNALLSDEVAASQVIIDENFVCPDQGRKYTTTLNRQQIRKVQLWLSEYSRKNRHVSMSMPIDAADGFYGKSTCKAILAFEIEEQLPFTTGSLDREFYEIIKDYKISIPEHVYSLLHIDKNYEQTVPASNKYENNSSKNLVESLSKTLKGHWEHIKYCIKKENQDKDVCQAIEIRKNDTR